MHRYQRSLNQTQLNLFSSVTRRVWLISASVMVTIAVLFHVVQNSGAIPGGSVPLVKTAWLFTVLFYWYVMPAIWLCDSTLAKPVKLVFAIALVNMILRALLELPLMYLSKGWLHAYGIGHDVFSIVLSLLLAVWLSQHLNRSLALGSSVRNTMTNPTWPIKYLLVSAILFAVEGMFALYLRSVTDANGSVFFLPAEQAHSVMLVITAIAVVLTWFATTNLLRLSHDQHA